MLMRERGRSEEAKKRQKRLWRERRRVWCSRSETKTINSWETGEVRTGPLGKRRDSDGKRQERGTEGVWGGLTERKWYRLRGGEGRKAGQGLRQKTSSSQETQREQDRLRQQWRQGSLGDSRQNDSSGRNADREKRIRKKAEGAGSHWGIAENKTVPEGAVNTTEPLTASERWSPHLNHPGLILNEKVTQPFPFSKETLFSHYAHFHTSKGEFLNLHAGELYHWRCTTEHKTRNISCWQPSLLETWDQVARLHPFIIEINVVIIMGF